MPLPIKPVHSLDLHAELFDLPEDSNAVAGLSALQAQLLGGGIVKEAAKTKLSEQTIQMLETIDKSQDDVVTAAQAMSSSRLGDTKVCRVPTSISDHDLLSLKAAELVRGQGRAVSLTDKARTALRDHYLTNPVNAFRANRAKTRFDLEAARSVQASEETGATRTASAKKFKRG